MLKIKLKSDGRIVKVNPIRALTPVQRRNSAIQPKTVWYYVEVENPKIAYVLTENDFEVLECIVEY